MRKRNLQKAVVLVVCFAFLGLSASGLSAAPSTPQPVKSGFFSTLLKLPAQWLIALFPGLRNIINPPQPTQVQPPTSSSSKVIKTTGTIKSIRLSGGD